MARLATTHRAVLPSSLLSAFALSMALFAASDMANAVSPSEAKHVNIRMQFVEIDRHEILDFSLDWDKPANADGMAFGLSSGDVPADTGLDKLLEALELEGKVDILAEPHLMSIGGEPASFMVGGEVPVSVPGNGSDAVEYKPFGMSVELVPTLGADDRIDVRVRPELTTINPDDTASDDIRLSSFTTHMAEATFDLASGQSIAIAGLFDREQSSNFADLPSLPVIDSLINSARFQRKETEFLILVTAYTAS